MNAQEIIEYIRTSEKKTPVKVYVWEDTPVDFPGCKVFPAGEGCKIVFGDWKDISPVLTANEFAHIEIENNCRNSAIPMLDLKDIPARIEPGAIIREQVEIGKNAVIMMGAILNIGAIVGDGTMIDMGAVLGGRATVGKRCHMGAGAVTSNVKSDKSLVVIHGERDIPTGIKKVGAMVGDGAEVGCNSVLNPGTVIGTHSNVYPLSSVRGYVPENSIFKSSDSIVEKR